MMVKAEGIVLRTTDYGESNKILTLYTESFGKIGLMAKGAKKPNSRLFACGHVLFYGLCLFNKGRGLGVLYQAESIQPFRSILANIEKSGYAALIVELTDRLTEEGKPSPPLYRLLRDILLLMEKGTEASVLSAIFSMKLMRLAGIEPTMDRCARCGRRQGPFRFSLTQGGFLCARCFAADPHAFPMSAATVGLLPLFKKVPVGRIGRVSVKRQTMKEIEAIIFADYEQNAGIRLRAGRFINQLDRMRSDMSGAAQPTPKRRETDGTESQASEDH
ncbi:MAG: DNA repair protein RecO [Sporolactobacillus sp.]|jgi:DNA repair protein RecO (recombination protein O)|nr:DNA repair protein RecO [Sporolactobacillus sp.]